MLMKVVATRSEPFQWAGGCLATLYKNKGSMADVTSYRAIWLVSILGKLLQRWLSQQMDWQMKGVLLDVQLGGVKHMELPYGVLALNGFMHWALDSRMPAAILFMDIKAAFDSMIRSTVIGKGNGDTKISTYLLAAGIEDTVVQRFLDATEDVAMLHEQGVDPWLVDLIQAGHRHVWFVVDNSDTATATGTGARAGDNFGTALFNLLMAKATAALRLRLR